MGAGGNRNLTPNREPRERPPVLLDTLAAAYAEVGMFAEALDLQDEALSKIDVAGQRDLYGQLWQRKALYEVGKSWREPPDDELRGELRPFKKVLVNGWSGDLDLPLRRSRQLRTMQAHPSPKSRKQQVTEKSMAPVPAREFTERKRRILLPKSTIL
jgi:hypothetical protein